MIRMTANIWKLGVLFAFLFLLPGPALARYCPKCGTDPCRYEQMKELLEKYLTKEQIEQLKKEIEKPMTKEQAEQLEKKIEKMLREAQKQKGLEEDTAALERKIARQAKQQKAVADEKKDAKRKIGESLDKFTGHLNKRLPNGEGTALEQLEIADKQGKRASLLRGDSSKQASNIPFDDGPSVVVDLSKQPEELAGPARAPEVLDKKIDAVEKRTRELDKKIRQEKDPAKRYELIETHIRALEEQKKLLGQRIPGEKDPIKRGQFINKESQLPSLIRVREIELLDLSVRPPKQR